LYVDRAAARLGLRRRAIGPNAFRCSAPGVVDRPSPGFLRLQVHPSVSRLPFRVPSLHFPPGVSRRQDRLARVSSLIVTSLDASTCAGVPSPLRSVHRRSQPLDGFLRTRALQACFIPQPRPGPSLPFRGFFLRAADSLLQEDRAPLPLACERSPNRSSAATLTRPDFEALLHTKRRFKGSIIKSCLRPLPSSGSSPPGSPFSRRVSRLTQDHPLMKSSSQHFARAPLQLDLLQRIINEKPGSFASKLPTCPRF